MFAQRMRAITGPHQYGGDEQKEYSELRGRKGVVFVREGTRVKRGGGGTVCRGNQVKGWCFADGSRMGLEGGGGGEGGRVFSLEILRTGSRQ